MTSALSIFVRVSWCAFWSKLPDPPDLLLQNDNVQHLEGVDSLQTNRQTSVLILLITLHPRFHQRVWNYNCDHEVIEMN